MLLRQYGYKWYSARMYEVRPTLFKEKDTSIVDDYINSDSNKLEKITVCENLNHQIILTRYCAVIRTMDGQRHLEKVEPVIQLIKKHIIMLDATTLQGVKFEARTIEYITDIKDVEKHFKGILIDADIKEEYNIKRDPQKDYYLKERIAECYTSKNSTRYFIENGMCMDKEIEFSTGEYYDERIGRVKIDIGVNYYNRDTKLTKFNFQNIIEELEEKQFKLFLKSHKDKYIETLI